jgi:hypothetical protein
MSLPRLEHRLRAVEHTLAHVERRLDRLEAHTPASTPLAPEHPGDREPDPTVWRPPDLAAWLTTGAGGVLPLAGRTVIVLGGAFLLRAITESGSLPREAGIATGFVYSLAWLGAADRAAPRSPHSATFHGLAAMLIGFPLIWEATVRFEAVGPWTATLALGVLAGLGLVVARHRDLPALAAGMTAGALVALPALAIATASPLPFTLGAMILTIATASWKMSRDWPWLRWPAGGASALMMLVLIVRAMGPRPLAPLPALLLLCGLYVVSGLWLGPVRLVYRRVRPGLFDAVQTAAVVALGIGGGILIAARLAPGLGFALALLALVLAAGSYAVALVLAADRADRGSSVLFLANQGLVLVLVSTPAVFDGFGLGLWLSVLTGVLAWTGARRMQPELLAHGAVCAVAAGLAIGLPAVAAGGWLAPLSSWPALPAAAWTLMAAATIALFGPRLAAGHPGDVVTAGARLVVATVLVATAGTAALVALGSSLVPALPAPGPVAALRTVVLAAAALAVTAAGRFHRGRALGRLTYPLLVLGAAKILADDLRHSGPLLLFVALGVYGLALILSARLRRTSS